MLKPGAQLDEGHVHALRVELLVELLEHARRSEVDVGDGFALYDDPAGLSLAHEVADLAPERAGVGEEQRRLPAVDDDAFLFACARVDLHAVPAVEIVDLTEHRAV